MANIVTLADIDHVLDNGNMPGIVPKLIYGYKEDVAVWPTEPDGSVTPLTLENAAKLTGDVVMKPNTRAYELDFTEDVGNFAIAIVGEGDSLHVENTLNIVKAKIKAKILGFMNAAMDRKMFFIIEDENGNNYLMGNSKRGATLAAGDGATTGTGSGDRNQVALQFKFRAKKALLYVGDTEDILTLVPES
jgi:hypothetical protein